MGLVRSSRARERIGGWCQTTDDYSAWERPGVYHFIERADGLIVGGLYGPRIFCSLNDEEDGDEIHTERPDGKMAKPDCHREFASLAAAKAWAIWDARRKPT